MLSRQHWVARLSSLVSRLVVQHSLRLPANCLWQAVSVLQIALGCKQLQNF